MRQVHNDTNRDFSRNKLAKEAFNEYQSSAEYPGLQEEIHMLSEAQDVDFRYQMVKVEKDQYNKYLRSQVLDKMSLKQSELLVHELRNKPMISEKALQMNRVNIEDYKQFKIEYFRKTETKRLIDEQELS